MDGHSVNWAKVMVAWLGCFFGGVTLSQVALVLTIVFTTLQIYRQVREIRRERRLERLEAKLRSSDWEPL